VDGRDKHGHDDAREPRAAFEQATLNNPKVAGRSRARRENKALPATTGKRSPVAELRAPARRAYGQQIEEMPDRAEIVARAEAGIGDAQHGIARALEHRDAERNRP
jgi:hypothetical protein